jgi:hypothetical protein
MGLNTVESLLATSSPSKVKVTKDEENPGYTKLMVLSFGSVV